MAARSKPSRSEQSAIKYRWVPLELASFDLSDIGREEDVSTLSDSREQNSKQCEPKSSEILSTTEFVSAVGRIWDCANRSLPVFQTEANMKHNESVFQKENVVCYSDGEINSKPPTSAETGYICVGLKPATCSEHMVNSNFECVGVARKMSLFKFCSRHDRHSFFWTYPRLGDSYMPVELWKVNGFTSIGIRISYDLAKIYGQISEKLFLGLKYPVNLTQNDCKKPGETCISGSKTTPTENLATESTDYNTNLTKCKDSPSGITVELVENVGVSVTSLYSDYFLRPIANLEATDAVSGIPSSILCADYHIDCLALGNCTFEECKRIQDDDNKLENSKRQPKELHLEDEPTTELCSLIREKPNHALAKQGHAFAGALAGTFVSLCLHPVDTIKTVIQSRSTGQKSICFAVESIISERGVTGLYRGIASNITSSAPISAVYTFTYESVKGALLPLLPKEYHSFAHCTAGGCASIATSFLFTPSERIKQQMQVGSHYQNCWTALVGILERGGLPSLYAGWGAVLCRNIPHSIIKFYTYESLKQLVLSSTESNAQPSTFQTLICGGLAGSTAALFTTPFDVVKTRLQTQIPGSLRRYNGVFQALQEIAKHEGLKGLYRGLTPRLVMYLSQGALFFASYEYFKSVFSFEVPQLRAPTIQKIQNMEDDSASPSPSPSPSASSSTSLSTRLPRLHS